MTMCIILGQADNDEVATGTNSGDLFTTYGATKGYLGGNELHPVARQGGTNGNPNPCFILSTRVLTATDDSGALIFGTAVPYLSGLSQKDSNDPTFPPALPGP